MSIAASIAPLLPLLLPGGASIFPRNAVAGTSFPIIPGDIPGTRYEYTTRLSLLLIEGVWYDQIRACVFYGTISARSQSLYPQSLSICRMVTNQHANSECAGCRWGEISDTHTCAHRLPGTRAKSYNKHPSETTEVGLRRRRPLPLTRAAATHV